MVQERLREALADHRNQDPGVQKAIEAALRVMARAGVVDPATGKVVETLPQEGLSPSPAQLLRAKIREFKTSLHTPELVHSLWQASWGVDGAKARFVIEVPQLPDHVTAELIAAKEAGGKGLIYVSKDVSTQGNRHLLGRIHSKMQSDSVQEGNSVTNETDVSGWRWVDMQLDAPNLSKNERELTDKFVAEGLIGMNLNEYIIATQMSKRLKGRYLDESTWSRLLGSRDGGLVFGVGCRSGGRLLVRWPVQSDSRYPRLGGRSSAGV